VIDDTYNAIPLHAPGGTDGGLAGAAPAAAVRGGGSTMLELGPESARLHAEAAREIAHRKPALVAAVGTFARVFESLRKALGGRDHGGGRRRAGQS